MDNKKRSVHLPQDIIEEILPILPVKSLLRFRCVSKSWRYLIGSERFIKTHLQKSTQNGNLAQHRVIFFSHRSSSVMKQCSLQSLLNNEPSIDLTTINDPTNNQFKGCRVIGCCNGLLCMLKFSQNIIILWNPATRISTKLPQVGIICSKLGFGWDEQNGAHKVFVNVLGQNQRIGKVYSTKTNSWKTAASGSSSVNWLRGKFAGGKLLWLHMFVPYIESFDLATEEFGRIKLPINLEVRSETCLGDIGGCLCIVFSSKPFDVWVMKESWSKLATIPLPRGYVTKLYWFSPSFGEGPNGEIFLILGHTLLVYNPKDNVFWGPRNIEGLAIYPDSHVYVESLISPVLVEGS